MNREQRLRFKGDDAYFRETMDGKYRIAKVRVAGIDKYEVWRKVVGVQDKWYLRKANMTHQEAVEFILHSQDKDNDKKEA